MRALCLLLVLFSSPVLAANTFYTKGPDNVGTLAPPISDYVNSYALAANTAETITWPTGAVYCNISAQAPFWINSTTTATIPSTDVTNGSASTLNPAQRKRGSESSFSIISSSSQQISVEFWFQ